MFRWFKKRRDEERARVLLDIWRDLHDQLMPILMDAQAARELETAIHRLMVSHARKKPRASLAVHAKRAPADTPAIQATPDAHAYGIVSLWLEAQALRGADAAEVRDETNAIITAALREAPLP